MNFAPGVEFDEKRHEYWYYGKRLSGVTGLIAKKLGLKMPQEYLGEHAAEGTHVHKAVQRWIEIGDSGSVHPGVKWLTETFYEHRPPMSWLRAETLVTDFEKYASAVDIIAYRPDSRLVDIYDIKKGSFNREYVTWQLSIYKYFIEKDGGCAVKNCVCICMKDREYYDIFPKPFGQVEKLLYG